MVDILSAAYAQGALGTTSYLERTSLAWTAPTPRELATLTDDLAAAGRGNGGVEITDAAGEPDSWCWS